MIKLRVFAAVAYVPVVSYTAFLAAVFIITAVSSAEPISITTKKLLIILMKSVSLPMLALYVVSLVPAIAVPFLLPHSSKKKSPLSIMTVVCWTSAVALVSIIPSIFSVIVADHPAEGLLIGFGAGLVSVFVFAVIVSGVNEKIPDDTSTQSMGLVGDDRHANTRMASFGRRGIT